MNPFERHAAEIAALLPYAMREDVKKEVLADLWNEFDAQQAGGDADERMARIVAGRESPAAIADALHAPRSALVGPRLFPLYKAVLGGTVALIVLCTFAIERAFADGFSWTTWFTALGLALLIAFAVVTLVFALLDRRGHSAPVQRIDWMSRIAGPRPLGVEVAGLVLAAALLFLLNVHPDWIGFYLLTGSPQRHLVIVPILSAGFLDRQLPYIDAWCALIIVSATLRIVPGLRRVRRTLDMLLRAAGLLVGLRILLDPAIFAAPDLSAVTSLPPEQAQLLAMLILPGILKALLAVFWASLLVRAAGMLRQAFGTWQRLRLRAS